MRRFSLTFSLILIMSVFLGINVFSELEITEIMYNPNGSSETGREWFEIYNNDNLVINLTNYQLFENNQTKNITLFNGSSILGIGEYAIISNSQKNSIKFFNDYPNYNKTLFLSSFTLSAKDYLALYNNSSLIDEVNYSFSCGDGYSSELKNLSLDNGLMSNWGCSLIFGGTPGKINSWFNYTEIVPVPNLIIYIYLHPEIYLSQSYDDLFKLEIENKNCSLKDEVVVNYNLSGEDYFKNDYFAKLVGCSASSSTGDFTPTTAGNYTLCGSISSSTVNETDFSDNSVCFNFSVIDTSGIPCDIALGIIADDLIYEQGTSLSYGFELNNDTFPFSIEYWVEDLFGKVVKSKYTTSSLSQKSWKTNIAESGEEDRVLFIKAELDVFCNDTNIEDNSAENLFIVVNEDVVEEIILQNETLNRTNSQEGEQSFLTIGAITPLDPQFGDLLKVELETYRGNTNKYAVHAWVENDEDLLSSETKVNLQSKYTSYKLSLPIQLKLNCDGKLEEGEAKLVVEGLGLREEYELNVEGWNNFCKIPSFWPGAFSLDSLEDEKEIPAESGEEPPSILAYGFAEASMNILSNPYEFTLWFNGDAGEHYFTVYSYLYRGNKCYSCENEAAESSIEFYLGTNEQKEINLSLQLDELIEEGEYKLRVEVYKDEKTTSENLITPIYFSLKDSLKSKNLTEKNLAESNIFILGQPRQVFRESNSLSKKQLENDLGYVVYESSSEKAKNLVLYFLVLVFGLIIVIMVRGK